MAIRLTGGKALIPGEGLIEAPVTIDGLVLSDGPGTEIDVSGHLILPGIVDLHGDGFERHVEPRRATLFPFRLGLANTDAEMAANGVTTAILAQSFSWEGGTRGPDFAERFVAALAAARPMLRTDLRVQLRYETHMVEEAGRLLAMVESGEVGYVVFNDHLPLAEDRLQVGPQAVAGWAANSGRTVEDFIANVRAHQARAAEVPATLARIATQLTELGLPFGSHDDETPETRRRFDALGARICEFPTTRETASEARSLGNPVLMGAPNVVRGGSSSGNVSAEDLVAAGLCDALVSDYYTPALAAAAWHLADHGVVPFAEAWALISAKPAAVIGLGDRGRIAPGLRADLTILDTATRRAEATIVAGRVTHLSGELASRWQSAPGARAAE